MRPAGSEDGAASKDIDGGELGQAATELALVLPLLAFLLLAVIQLTLVARDEILVVHAARAAAREAAVDARPASVEREARLAASSLKESRLRVETSPTEGAHPVVIVAVHYRAPTEVPLVGPLLPDVELEEKAAMRSERRAASGKGESGSTATRQEPRPSRSNPTGSDEVGAEAVGLGNIPRPCGRVF